MRVIEQKIVGKRSEIACEDRIVVTKDFIAVIDGSTSKSSRGKLKTGESSGQFAARAVAEIIKGADPKIRLENFCKYVSEALYNMTLQNIENVDYSVLKNFPEERPCCSAIIFSNFWREIWMIGDCHGLILDSQTNCKKAKYISNPKPYESSLAKKRSDFLNMALEEGVKTNGEELRTYSVQEIRKHDIGREHILPDLLEAMKGENIEYAVIDGFPIPLDKVKRYGNLVSDCTELVFATDGYPQLFPTLEETETYLQNYLKSDPLFIKKHKETKCWMEGTESFDDRTYLRFTTYCLNKWTIY
ncbi:MAG: hypothetical protein HUJ97_06110 [Bacteroidales bacterium]|nr:hypothetical protein [Bacteroidales bacterium]